MKEANAPIDINKEQMKPYKKSIDNTLIGFPYNAGRQNIPDMIRHIDEEDPEIMSDLEKHTYTAIRDGMQVFKAVSAMVNEKVGLNDRMARVDSSKILTDPELLKLEDFTYNFAAYAASSYISKKVSSLLSSETDVSPHDKPDLDYIRLDTAKVESNVLNQLLTPVAAGLMEHVKNDKREFFKTPHDFSLYVRDVFDKYAEITKSKKDAHSDMLHNIESYRFRIMDDFLSLQGFEDKSSVHITMKEKKPLFAPIDPNEIMGNKIAKQKIYRYAQRIVLYDPVKQMNPILQLGGLAWSAVGDGPPGTGKTSLWRLFMTLLDQYANALGIPYALVSIDQTVKDEFYGKTGKIVLERLEPTKDPSLIVGVGIEDIDLLTSKRSDAQGADNDINNILMQYLDGAYTLRRGNIFNWASTNKATGLDEAMRNRFNDRLYIDGPVTAEDFADMAVMFFKTLKKEGFVKIPEGYHPMETQKLIKELSEKEVIKMIKSRSVEKTVDDFAKKYKKANIYDFGKFMADAKVKNNGITGRSMKAISEAIKERSADFDIPSEWLNENGKYRDLPWDTKVNKLKELYTEVTPEILFDEAQRYIDSEIRYAKKDEEEAIHAGYNSARWQRKAMIQDLREQVKSGEDADAVKLAALEIKYDNMMTDAKNAIITAFTENPKKGKEMIDKIMGDTLVDTP